MRAGLLGYIDTPTQGNHRWPGVTWCADNGCYGDGYPGDAKWFAWLERNAYAAPDCAFAVAPDVVGDAAATLVRSAPWLPKIRALGYPAAFVAQDGQESLPVPWGGFDVLFIGGTTGWKLGPHPRALVVEARHHGKPIHWGRVNSERRLRYVHFTGADSCDGTYLIKGPDTNLPKLLRKLRNATAPDLWEAHHA